MVSNDNKVRGESRSSALGRTSRLMDQVDETDKAMRVGSCPPELMEVQLMASQSWKLVSLCTPFQTASTLGTVLTKIRFLRWVGCFSRGTVGGGREGMVESGAPDLASLIRLDSRLEVGGDDD